MTILTDKKLSSIDPVCGLEIIPTETNPVEVIKGHTYYFCTAKCHNTFQINPLKYIDILNFLSLDKKYWQQYFRHDKK